MSRVAELAERERALRLHCAAQRNAIAREVASVETRLATVDRVAAITRRIVTHPAVVVGGLLLMVSLGRARSFQLLGRGLLLANAARRLLRLGSFVMPRRDAGLSPNRDA